MDLLLNMLWVALWIGVQIALIRGLRCGAVRTTVPYFRCALLLSCIVILLFPVISTADDICWLHRVNHHTENIGVSQKIRGSGRHDCHADLVCPPVVIHSPSVDHRLTSAGSISPTDEGLLAVLSDRAVPVLRGPPSFV